MKVGTSFKKPTSSFLIVEKDIEKIMERMLQSSRLQKLLYYTDSDCLSKPTLDATQKKSLINNQITIIPKINVTKQCPIYVIVGFTQFSPNAVNPQYRDSTVAFNILCHPDHWNLGDFYLRPYKIAGEIDTLFDNTKMTGIGEFHFLGAGELVLNNQLMGLTLLYDTIYSTEDMIPNE